MISGDSCVSSFWQILYTLRGWQSCTRSRLNRYEKRLIPVWNWVALRGRCHNLYFMMVNQQFMVSKLSLHISLSLSQSRALSFKIDIFSNHTNYADCTTFLFSILFFAFVLFVIRWVFPIWRVSRSKVIPFSVFPYKKLICQVRDFDWNVNDYQLEKKKRWWYRKNEWTAR